MEKNIKKVTIIENLGYGLGNLGFGVVFQTLSTYLLFYSTAVLGLSGAVVGSILAVGVFWDALTDPLVGYLSDITYSKKWGRRHLYMLIGAIAVSILNYKLWNINSSALSNEKLIAITIYILLIKTFLTLYGTPYTALGGEITEDYEERTWIQSYKTVFFMLGLSFPTVAGMLLFFVPTAEYPVGQLNPMAYTDMSVFVSILMLVTSLIAIVATKSYIPNTLKGYNEEDKDRSILKSFKLALKNKYFIHIFVGYLAVNIASALLSSVGMHVFTYTFEESNTEIALTMGMFFLWSIISLPVWLKVGKKIEKQEVMILALKIAIALISVMSIMVLARDFVITHKYILVMLIGMLGFSTGALFMYPLSMTADAIDYEEYVAGTRSEGIYYGCLTFGYKVAQAAVIFIVGILLDFINFDSSLNVQSESTVITMGLIFSCGSLIAFLIAYYSYKKYTLTKTEILEIQNNKKNV